MEPEFLVMFDKVDGRTGATGRAVSDLFPDYKTAKRYYDSCAPCVNPVVCVVMPYAPEVVSDLTRNYLESEADKGNPNAARALASRRDTAVVL